MAEAVPPGTGLVAALLGLSADVVKAVCQEAASVGVVAAANFNSPGQVVIAGEKAAVERAIEIAKAKGCKKAIPLPGECAGPYAADAEGGRPTGRRFGGVTWRDLTVPLVNNAEATALTMPSDIQASLVRQLPSSVRWEDSVQTMAALGVTTFVEIGPGTVLRGLVKRILPDAVTRTSMIRSRWRRRSRAGVNSQA